MPNLPRRPSGAPSVAPGTPVPDLSPAPPRMTSAPALRRPLPGMPVVEGGRIVAPGRVPLSVPPAPGRAPAAPPPKRAAPPPPEEYEDEGEDEDEGEEGVPLPPEAFGGFRGDQVIGGEMAAHLPESAIRKTGPLSEDMFTLLTKGSVGQLVTHNYDDPQWVGMVAGRFEQTVVDISGPDVYATVVNLTLVWQPKDPNNFGVPSANRRAWAHVWWGNAAGLAEARLDMLNGQCLQLYGSRIRVNVVPIDMQALGENASFQLGAFASLFPMGKAGPVQYTFGGVAGAGLPPAGVVTFFIPPFARALRVMRAPALAFNLDFANYDGIPLHTVVVGAGQNMGAIELPGTAKLVILTNTNAVGNFTAELCWDLALN